ncbi:LEPR-XLL domain-containing protein, partial [Yoonia sp. 72]
MSMPFDRQTAGVLPKIPLNRGNRARLRRHDRARFDRIKEAAWRLLLDPMEQRVLLSADPLTVNLATTAGAADAVTVRFFEGAATADPALTVQKVSIQWSGALGAGGQDIYEIGTKDGFVINTGAGDESVSIVFDSIVGTLDPAFSIVVNTEGGDDSITVTSFAAGYGGDLNLSAEQITINSGVSLGTDTAKIGKVTLDAQASATGTGVTPVASVTISGSIVSDDVVTISAEAVAASNTVGFAAFDIQATATVAVGDDAVIRGEAISLTAGTRVDVTIASPANFTLVDDIVQQFIADNKVQTTTTVTIGAGAEIVAGSGDLDTTKAGDQSLFIGAGTVTNIDIDLESADSFFSGLTDLISGLDEINFGSGDDFIGGFDLLISTLDVARTTGVLINGTSDDVTTINAGGLADITATSGGEISHVITSDFVGVAMTNFSTDVTQIIGTHLSSETLGLSLQATSLTQSISEGKVATNQSGDAGTNDTSNVAATRVTLSDSTINAGADGIRIGATDQARFYATSTSATLDPNLFKKVSLDYAAALNLLNRDTKVTLTNTVLDADGAVSARAQSAVWSIVLAEKMQALGEDETPFDNGTNSGTGSAFVFGGTLAVNEMNGDVSVTTTGGRIEGSTVTIDATNTAIFNSRSEAGQSLSGKSGGAVGISAAVNVLGFRVNSYLGLAIDALLGIGMGTTLDGYGAAVTMTGTAVNATGAAAMTANNQLKANAFMSNAAKSEADSAFKNNSGAAAAFALATNKIATRARVDISGTGGNIVAGTLDVTAKDDAQITAETLIVSSSVSSSNFGLALADTLIASFAEAKYRTDGTNVFVDGPRRLSLEVQPSTLVDLTFGDRVMLLPSFEANDDRDGTASTTYRFMGASATGVDLTMTDFTDKSLWQAAPETDIVPTDINLSETESTALGGMLVRNEVNTEAAATVANIVMTIGGDTTISATEDTLVTALGDIGILSSGGSSLTGGGKSLAAGGALVINTVRGQATATVTNVAGSVITGDLAVLATNTITLDATLNAMITSEDESGFLLIAFNTLGYNPGNLLEQTLDALIGLELGTKTVATTTAGIDSDGITARSITVTATNEANLTSLRTSEASSVGAAMSNAGGKVMSGTLVSNALAGGAEAYIRNASTTGITTTGGGVSVTADDNATLKATSASIAAQSAETDIIGGAINSIAQTLLDSYTYTDKSGTQALNFGDTVYVDGVIYRYLGTGTTSTDLAEENYENLDLWKVMTATTIVPSQIAKLIAKLAGLKAGDSKSSFAMITRNEVEGGAKAFVMNATITAQGTIEVTATERSRLTAFETSQIDAKETKSGVIATNAVLSQAQAFVERSTLTANGTDSEIIVKALNLIVADATVTVATSAKGDALGLVFAFNTVGYDNHNVFFQAAEALLGADYLTPLVSENRTYGAEAFVNRSTLTADGDIRVSAESRDLVGTLDGTVTAQMLDDISDVRGDSDDAAKDAAFVDALRAQLIAIGALDAGSTTGLKVETLAVGRQWYVIAEDGTIWQVLAERNADDTATLVNVYLVNLLNARIGNDQSVKAKNDMVLVDRFIAQDKLDQDEAAAKEKGEEFKGKLKYGTSGAAAGGILASNKVLSETKAWISGDLARFNATQTVSELLTGDVVRSGETLYRYDGPNQVRVTAYDFLSITEPVALADQATIKLSADITEQVLDIEGLEFLTRVIFRAGDILRYTGAAQSDVDGIDLETFIRANSGSFAVINPVLAINLSAITYATDPNWTAVTATDVFTVTSTNGTVTVFAADTANLRVDASLSVLAEVSNNIDGFKKLAAQFTAEDYSYTTSSGVQNLFAEDVIRIGTTGPASEVGKFYRFIGGGLAGALGTPLAQAIPVDLGALVADNTTTGALNLLDALYWEEISDDIDLSDALFPDLGNLSDSSSKAMGGIIILNDVQGGVSARIDRMTVIADADVDVTAIANASLLANIISSVESSGGSAWGSGDSIARQGVIATNVARNSALAEIAKSDVTATDGDVTVTALQQTVMDATVNVTSNTGDEGKTVTLAFNSLGYNASNVLFNSIEAVTTDPTFHRLIDPSNPASAKARIIDTNVAAGGDVSVDAQSAELLNATVSNTTDSAAGALTGANGSAFGLIIASNKVLGEASALIDNANALTATIDSGGDISVTAEDRQRHFSNVKMVAASATSNDGGAAVLQETLNDVTRVDWVMTGQPQPAALRFGDLVRVADSVDDFGGKIMQYMGPNNPGVFIDLNTVNFGDTDFWKESLTSKLIPQGLNVPNAGEEGQDSDSTATGAMFVYNELNGKSTAEVRHAILRADVDITIRATLNSEMNATTDAATSSSGGTVAGTGTSRAISGVVATNLLTGSATASAQNATLTARADESDTTGNVTVEALNTVKMTATTSAIVATGDQGFNVLLAFNSMGYAPTNLLFNSFDALVGDANLADDLAALNTRVPVQAHAFMTGVTVDAAGAIIVNAVNNASLTALVNNETTSAASAFVDASGKSVSAILSMNKMLAGARAEIDGGQYYATDGAKIDIKTGDQVIAADGTVYERTGGDVTIDFGSVGDFAGGAGWTATTVNLPAINTLSAGRAVIVTASDDSSMDADNVMQATTTVVNDGGLSILTGLLENLFADYAFTTFSGLQLLRTGQQVLAGSNMSPAQQGNRYLYVGPNSTAPVNLATVDFTNASLWREVDIDDIESLIPPGINLNVTKSDATAVGLMFSVNDLQSGVIARLAAATVDVEDGYVLVSAVENALMDALNEGTVKADGGSLFAEGSKVVAVNANVATNNVTSFALAEVIDADVTVGDAIADNDSTAAVRIAGRAGDVQTITPKDGDLVVMSKNTAGIHAAIDTSTIAEGGGGKTVAVGASIAFNSVGVDGQNILFNLADTFIGTTVATPNPSSATARVARSTVDVADDLSVTADNLTTINAEIVNAAVATGVSVADRSDAVSVGAIIAMNRTAADTVAEIVAAPTVQVGGSVTVTADDVSAIDATVTATSVSAAVGTGGSKSVSVAASFARNEITSNARAEIRLAEVTAGEDVAITATRDAQIMAKGLSAAVAVGLTAGGGNGGDVSFSGGGAVGFNSIRGQATAKAVSSTLDAAGDIKVDAKSMGRIDATVLAASVSGMINIGGSGTKAVGIGVVYVDNMIGYDQTTPDLSGETVLTTAQSVTTVQPGTYVRGADGTPMTGHVYRYIGNAPRQVLAPNPSNADPAPVVTNGVDLAIEDYSDTSLWERVDLIRNGQATALASLDNVRIGVDGDAPDSLSVTALSAQTINATAAAAAVAMAGSSANAAAIAGGGAAARNRIAGGAIAEITGNASDITAGSVDVVARDASTINSLVGAAAISAAVSGKTAVSVSVGLALAFNEVANQTTARIVGADVTATGATGVKVTAETAPPRSFEIAAGGLVTAAGLDDLSKQDVLLDVNGEPVLVAAGEPVLDANGDPVLDTNGEPVLSDVAVVTDAARDGDILSALVGLIDANLADETVAGTVGNLSELVFAASDDGRGWFLIDGLGRKFTLIPGAGDTFTVEIATINAVSAAAAFSVAGGKSGAAIAGAGAYSENVVLSNTSAYIDAARIAAELGNVEVAATNKSAINAITVAAAMSVGLGKTGIGVSVGAAISQNLIGAAARGVGDSVGTFAYIKDSEVSAFGDVIVTALSEQKINALNVAGSAAIAGGKVGVAVSGSGVYVRNVIDSDTSARIIGDMGGTDAAIEGNNVTVKAENKSVINVIAATVSVSFAFGKGAVAVALGVTVAENQIFGLTSAHITDVNSGGVLARTGDVLVQASDSARINAIAAAGALAIAGGAVGIGVALAGALAFNRLGAGVSAQVNNSLITAGRDVSILASADGRIDAVNGALSAALGAGGTGVGIAIGAAFVSNQIGYQTGTMVANHTSDETVNRGVITAGKTVQVTSGIHAGRMFQYIGETQLEGNYELDGDRNRVIPATIDLSTVDYSNPERWVEVNLDKTGVLISAKSVGSDIVAGRDLLIDAQSNQKINAASLAVAAGLAFGGTGVGVSLSGSAVLNRIATKPEAAISGKLLNGVTARTVTVQADDESTINAASIAGALSIAAGGTGVAVSLGVSLAFNAVENAVSASIDTQADVTATGLVNGNSILVRAGSATQNAENTLNLSSLGSADEISDDLDDAAGTDVEMVDGAERVVQADIDADRLVLQALKTALQSNFTVEGDLRISVLLEGQRWIVVDGSGTSWSLTRNGSTFVAERATINAIVGAVSLAAGFGGTGVAVAGAGAFGQNVVLSNVSAHISDATVAAPVGHVKVLADSASLINSAVLATSVAVAAGATGVSAAVGVSVAQNYIGKSGATGAALADTAKTEAFISNSSVTAAGDLVVKATSSKTINALVFAGAAAISVGETGIALSGSGVSAENLIAGSTEARITLGDQTVRGGTITVQALDVSRIEAIAAALSLSLAFGNTGVSVALGVSVAQNTIGTLVRAAVTEVSAASAGSLIATAGNVLIDARDDATIRVISAAAAIAAAGGITAGVAVSGAGALAFNRITNRVTAEVVGATINAATATTFVPTGEFVAATSGAGSQIFNPDNSLNANYLGALTLARDLVTGAIITRPVFAGDPPLQVGTEFALVPVTGPTLTNDQVFLPNTALNARPLVEYKVKSEEVTRTITDSNGDPVEDTITVLTFLPLSDPDGIGLRSVFLPDPSFVDPVPASPVPAVVSALVPVLMPGVAISQDVAITATGNARIEAAIISAAVSLGIGGVAGVGVGIGTSYARNEIGNGDTSGVFARVQDAVITANRDITVSALMTSSITAHVGSFAVALAGGFVGVAGAGAGAFAVNTINYAVDANVTGATMTAGRAMSITAADNATINATVDSAALSLAAGVVAFAGSVAVSTAQNTVDNSISASVNNADVRAASLAIRATDDTTVTVVSRAAALSAAIGLGGALSGGGALAEITATSTVSAQITGTGNAGHRVNVGGTVTVEALNRSDLSANVKVLSVAAGLVGLAASGSVARINTRPVGGGNSVQANVGGVTLTAGTLNMDARSLIKTAAGVEGITVASTAAVGVSEATILTGARVGLQVGSNQGSITVGTLNANAISDGNPEGTRIATADASASGGGLLIGVNSTFVRVSNTDTVAARVGNGATVNAANFTMTAASNVSQLATSRAASAGLVGVGAAVSIAQSDTNVSALVGTGAKVNGVNVTISAGGQSNNDARTETGAYGLLSGAAAAPQTDTKATITAGMADATSLANRAEINATGLLRVSASQLSRMDTEVVTASYGAIAGAGAVADNKLYSKVDVVLGNFAKAQAGAMDLQATNKLLRVASGNDINGKTGGIASGASATSDTRAEMRTAVTFGNNADIDTTNPQGKLYAKAFNEIAYTDKVRLETAGALSGAGAFVTFNQREDGVSVPITADINVGNNARIEARGELEFEASGKFNVYLQSYSETYGAATVALGSAIIDIQPRNTITVKSGAQMLAHRDMFLSTGTDRNLKIEDNSLEARVDNFAGSAIPIDDLKTQAIYLVRNVILVEGALAGNARAVVESYLNIDLNADSIGLASVIGMAKGTNWVSAVRDGVNSLFGGADNSTGPGEGLAQARSEIINNGLIQTGARRNLQLTIGEERDASGNLLRYTYNGTLDPNFTGTRTPGSAEGLLIKTREVSQFIPSAGEIALREARTTLEVYGVKNANGTFDDGNAFTKFYLDTIARIEGQMLAAGEAILVGGVVVPINRESRVIVFDDIVAAAGRIRILTDQLHGTGTFDAPQNVNLSIDSNSTASLQFGEIYIPERNGGVDFNGVTVTAATSIDEVRNAVLGRNEVSVTQDNRPLGIVGGLGFLGTVDLKSPNSLVFTPQSIAEGTGSAPVINVQVLKNVRTVPFGTVSLPTNDQVVTFTGRVFAPLAQVGVFGPAGSNEVSVVFLADVNVANVVISVGGTIAVDIKGDLHTNGDPYGKFINSGILGNTPLTAGTLNALRPDPGILDRVAEINRLAGPQTGSSATYVDDRTGQLVQQGMKANTILLRGGYVNVNGLIQAGQSEFTLILGDYVRNQLLAATGVVNINLGNPDFFARYDAGLKQLTILAMSPKGGQIDIEGRIVATSQGKLISHAGYPKISIINQMNIAGIAALQGLTIVIESMDVSQKGVGTIVLKDKTRGVRNDGSDLATHATIYTTDANGVVTMTGGLIDSRWDPLLYNDADKARFGPKGTVNTTATHSSGANVLTSTGDAITSKLGYGTATGFRYGWVVGEGAQVKVVQEKTYRSLWGLDFLLADTINMPVVSRTVLSTSLLPNSNYFYFDSNTDTNQLAYTYNSSTVTTEQGTPKQTAYSTTTSWYGKSETFIQITTINQTFTKHNHTIAANKTIDIEFTGFNQSELFVNAGQANLIIAGQITNENGRTTLISQGTVTTQSVAAQGLTPSVGGRIINITGLAGVGVRDFGLIRPADSQFYTPGDSRALNALQVSQSANGVLNVTSVGDILLQQRSGDLRIGSIISAGDGLVEILAGTRGQIGAGVGGSILNASGGSLVKGGSIRLDADREIGGATAITIDTGVRSTDVLTAFATDDINLYQNTNSLRVFQIASSAGDVTVTLEGEGNDLLDGNQIQEIDVRSREALLGGVWGDMQLLGDVTVLDANGIAAGPAGDKIREAIARLNNARVDDYRTYWSWRNLLTAEELQAVVDRTALIKLSENGDTSGLQGSIAAQLIASGLSPEDANTQAASQIVTLQQTRTAQFLEQHARYGAETAENTDPNIDLTSAAEKEEIKSRFKVWTEAELLNAIGSGLLKPVTDTTINIEDPNIIGARVTLNVEGKVGRTEGEVTILLSEGRSLTQDEQLIIAAAERSDLFFLVTEIETVNVTFDRASNSMTRSSGTWNAAGQPEFLVGQTIQVQGGDPVNATENGRYYVIAGFSGDGRTMLFENTGTTFAQDVLTVAFTDPIAKQVRVSAIVNDPSGSSIAVIANLGGDTITRTGGTHDFLGNALNGGSAIDGFRVGDYILLSTTPAYTPQAFAAKVETLNANTSTTLFRIASVTANSMTLIDEDGDPVALVAETGVTLTIDEFVKLAGLQVQQREDFNIEASDSVNITSIGETFVGSENQILLGAITVTGDGAGAGQLRLKAGNGIISNVDASITNITADSVVLEGGRGSIGRLANETLPENRIYMELSEGSIVTARSQNEIVLAERTGDFLVGTIYSASSDVDIRALDGDILDGFGNDLVNIEARNIILQASGNIGTADNDLDLEARGNGQLTLLAGGNIYVTEAGDMNLRQVISTGETSSIRLTAEGNMFDADSSDAAGIAVITGYNIETIAEFGLIGGLGKDLRVNTTGGVLNASALFGNIRIIEVSDDLILDQVGVGEGFTAFITAIAGRILNGAALGVSNVTGGRAFLTANRDIGQADKRLFTTIGSIQGVSTTGSAYIFNDGAIRAETKDGTAEAFRVATDFFMTATSPIDVRQNIIAASGNINIIANESVFFTQADYDAARAEIENADYGPRTTPEEIAAADAARDAALAAFPQNVDDYNNNYDTVTIHRGVLVQAQAGNVNIWAGDHVIVQGADADNVAARVIAHGNINIFTDVTTNTENTDGSVNLGSNPQIVFDPARYDNAGGDVFIDGVLQATGNVSINTRAAGTASPAGVEQRDIVHVTGTITATNGSIQILNRGDITLDGAMTAGTSVLLNTVANPADGQVGPEQQDVVTINAAISAGNRIDVQTRGDVTVNATLTATTGDVAITTIASTP